MTEDKLFKFRSSGGKERAKKLTPERRKEIAMMGVEAREKKRLSKVNLQASKE